VSQQTLHPIISKIGEKQTIASKLHTNKAAASAQNIIVPITEFLIKNEDDRYPQKIFLNFINSLPWTVGCGPSMLNAKEVPRPELAGH
jgi:hypothetical protein